MPTTQREIILRLALAVASVRDDTFSWAHWKHYIVAIVELVANTYLCFKVLVFR
jgi:hypothetical protein